MSNNRARADHCARADLDAAHDHGPAPNRCRATHGGFLHRPVLFRLRRPVAVGRARFTIVDEDHAMADEDFVLDRHAAANEAMAGDLAVLSDSRVLLNLNKSPDFRVVTDFATIKIDELRQLDVLTELDVEGNAIMIHHS